MIEQCPTLVAAGIVVKDGCVLVCQRRHDDPYGMQWEFPGGKAEANEELATSLRRELFEELEIQAQVGDEILRLRHRYPDRYVEVAFFLVLSFEGIPQNCVFERIEWARREDLSHYRFLDADREIVDRIVAGGIF